MVESVVSSSNEARGAVNLSRTSQNIIRVSKFSEKTLESFKRGNVKEAENIAKNGESKNYRKFDAVDNKTGKSGKYIPDAFKDNVMIEYKHVEKLSLTKQLRYGLEVAKNLQKNPVLRVPQKIVGNLSKPLIESGWDIQY
ncbi:putative toxin [Flavobacterium branchiophilum]|nr:putative toxin [Flavobacterium branchiophilum]